MADVPRPQPVAEEHLGCFVRPVPVARRHLRSAHADLARFADIEFPAIIGPDRDEGRWDRQADGAVEIEADRIDAGRGRGLRQAPGLRQHAAGDFFPAGRDRGLYRHATPERHAQLAEVDIGEIRVMQQRVEQRVDAADEVEPEFLQLLDEAREIARIGDQDVVRPFHHEQQAVRRQGEDMVERQCGDHDHLRLRRQGRFDPRIRLQHIGDHVAMGQDRALRDAGRPAGVLQECDIVCACDDVRQRLARACRERCSEVVDPGDAPRRDLSLDIPKHEVDEPAARLAEQVPDARYNDRLHRRARQHLLEHMGEVLEYDDRCGPGID